MKWDTERFMRARKMVVYCGVLVWSINKPAWPSTSRLHVQPDRAKPGSRKPMQGRDAITNKKSRQVCRTRRPYHFVRFLRDEKASSYCNTVFWEKGADSRTSGRSLALCTGDYPPGSCTTVVNRIVRRMRVFDGSSATVKSLCYKVQARLENLM